MHDVVADLASYADRGNARRAGLANVFVRLVFALRRMMLVPFGVFVPPDVCHGESVERRAVGHRDTRACAVFTAAVDDSRLGSFEPEFSFRVLAGTS